MSPWTRRAPVCCAFTCSLAKSTAQCAVCCTFERAGYLPLSVSWAILLAGLMDALQPFEGKEITEDQWAGIAAQAVETAAAVYPKTAPDQIRADLNAMLTSFRALTAGQEPPVHVQPMDLGAYARYMAAPHRMDLMVSSMEKDGAWHCNQKCLHCYAANQPLGAVKELDTDQWLAVIQNAARRAFRS